MSFVIQMILFTLLAASLIISAITDLKFRRIMNLVTLPSLVVALLLHTAGGGAAGLIFGIKGLGFGFVCLIIPYLMGIMGAGDVKLMSVVGAVTGFEHTLFSLSFIAMAGGILAMVLLLKRRVLKQSFNRIWTVLICFVTIRDMQALKYSKDDLTQEGMPFAVAISTGVFLYSIYVWKATGMLPVLGPS